MKVCLNCEKRFQSAEWRCPRCHFEPASDGFLQFAPELANANDGFEAASFDHLARLEPTSFWFRSRNRLVIQLLREHFPDAKSLLEIGCGTGYVLSGLREALPSLRLAGSELHLAGLRYASRRLPGADLYQMDCRRIPFDSEFDVVCALDVLEHVDEDEQALIEMRQAARPGGGVLVSVPQHPWLWSAGDTYSHHKRRYRRGELKTKLEAAGLVVDRMTSFVGFLLPLMALSRLRQRDLATYDPQSEYRSPRLVDRVLEAVLTSERALIGRGVSLPAGGSLVAVAQRPKT